MLKKNFVQPYISVIITTYNRPDALKLILKALANQTDMGFEVVIADDGSGIETRQLIDSVKETAAFPLSHYWQEDQGFRAAKARNQAASMAKGEYLIFLDGDCVPTSSFIARHKHLASPGFWVAGNRILLSAAYTNHVLSRQLPIYEWGLLRWIQLRRKKACNRLLPFITLPLGPLRKMQPKRWQGAKTCNLALWKQDFLKINGFEEAYEGWGYEDSDLVIRLIRAKVFRKNAHFCAAVFHLWHPENDRSNTAENLARLKKALIE